MLQVNNLDFSYSNLNGKILEDISFNVEEGTLCGLFGPNGCGKSTLFKCCLNFLKIKKGNVRMDKKNIKDLKIKDMAKIVSYVPQEHKPPFPYLVEEVVLMGRTPHLKGFFGIGKKDLKKTRETLELLEISHLSKKIYTTLSGGQRQLVLMARAIAQETKIMFLDEPTSALDFSNQLKIWKIIKKISESGVTILACSHDPNHVSWFCDKVVVVNNKNIVNQGSPEDVITQATLDLIYEDMCDVKKINNTNFVFPSDLKCFENNLKKEQLIGLAN